MIGERESKLFRFAVGKWIIQFLAVRHGTTIAKCRARRELPDIAKLSKFLTLSEKAFVFCISFLTKPISFCAHKKFAVRFASWQKLMTVVVPWKACFDWHLVPRRRWLGVLLCCGGRPNANPSRLLKATNERACTKNVKHASVRWRLKRCWLFSK